ncbi:hypothetical protein JCM8547_005782 [Rhodosporidiobolus lusitaniae]
MDGLRSLTSNLPSFVRDPAVVLVGQHCYTSIVEEINLSDTECLKLGLSKGLGVAILAGGAIVKLPQIISVVSSGSAKGLSLSSYVLDTAATAITVAYNIRRENPFSTYGEMLFLLVQNAVLIVLITGYSPRPTLPRLVPIAVLFSSLAYALSSTSFIPDSTLSFLQTLTIPLSLSSKVPQILQNFRSGSTGQLSAFLVINSLAGCVARVFTTRTETNDPILFWGYFLGALLNGVIAFQLVLYRGKSDVDSSSLDKLPIGHIQSSAGIEKAELTAVVQAGAEKVAQSATPTKGGLPKRTASPASAGGSARRYVRKLD